MWTDERVAKLRKLYEEGLSFSQIAVALGGTTRNSVTGKVHRLKLTLRGRTPAQARPKKAAQALQISTAVRTTRIIPQTPVGTTTFATPASFDPKPYVEARPVENVFVPASRRLKLVELSERTCKWPTSDGADARNFNFCGNDADGPYCAYHKRIAFQPASKRRRAR